MLVLIFCDVDETDMVFDTDGVTLVRRGGFITCSCVGAGVCWSNKVDWINGSDLMGLLGFSTIDFTLGFAGDFFVGFLVLFTPGKQKKHKKRSPIKKN